MTDRTSPESESADDPVNILRGWARAYRDSPQHRFPSDPDAEFFPVDLEAAANEIERLREYKRLQSEDIMTLGQEIGRFHHAQRTKEPGSMSAQWAYDPEARAYYFAPLQAAAPPYTTREVTAIIDIASDGTLAGVELVEMKHALPEPPVALSVTSPLRECGFCGGPLPCLTHSQGLSQSSPIRRTCTDCGKIEPCDDECPNASPKGSK
jgi:hypothetical protein